MSLHAFTDPDCQDCDPNDAVDLVVHGKPRTVGNFEVARVLPTARRRMVGPFIFLDHMGPVQLAPGAGFDVLPHPHIGLSTVTYLFEGRGMHRDSLGNACVIEPGDVNLMTAGTGVVHSERSTDEDRAAGGTFHGLQLWVALTEDDERRPPTFVHLERSAFPHHRAPGVDLTVLLGSAYGLTSPLPHASKPVFLDTHLEPGTRLDLPEGMEHGAVYLALGGARLGGQDLEAHDLAVCSPGARPSLLAKTACRAFILGGPTLGERFIDWNFVSSSKERIEQAKRDWVARAFPTIPGDDVEFVPLPPPRTR